MIDGIVEALHAGNPVLMVFAGLAVGLVHAFEPDHLSAVSTLNRIGTVSPKRPDLRRLAVASSLRGMMWGAGHTSSIILVGLLIAGLSLSVPDGLFAGAELAVGLVLIALGVLVARNRGVWSRGHAHPHTHEDGTSHTHRHTHGGDHRHGHRAYLIGCLHGLAGSGGLVALMASTAGGFEAVIYFLALFGAGSIAGMSVAGGAMGLPLVLLARTRHAVACLRYAVAGMAVAVGISIVHTVWLAESLL